MLSARWGGAGHWALGELPAEVQTQPAHSCGGIQSPAGPNRNRAAGPAKLPGGDLESRDKGMWPGRKQGSSVACSRRMA